MGGPPDPALEPTTDEFDLFQGDFTSYSQLMSQMSLDPGAGTSDTQYDALCAHHHTTLLVRLPKFSRRRHRRTQDTSTLTVKFGRETHIVRLSFGGCFIGVDVLFFRDGSLSSFVYIFTFIFSFMVSNLVFLIYIFTLTSYKNFI
jgi:hypothetical protein